MGEYRVSHKLGEGGMGAVYAGVHPVIGKRVAIKVLAPHAAAHADLLRRFKEEARAVNKIGHPNIIDIFAFNQLPDGRDYFVMEHLAGESLATLLARGATDLDEMRRLIGQMCSGLEAAHHAGVVHRDLKPDNIWVVREGFTEPRIKILDFGIAKLNDIAISQITQTGVPMGTPHYMPPEQGLGRPVDHRADIYAFGVILYQVFAGTLPFQGATAPEIVLKHVMELPPPPSRHRPIVPPGMEAVILDCLQKSPADRPASIEVLRTRIEAAFSGGGEQRPDLDRRGAVFPATLVLPDGEPMRAATQTKRLPPPPSAPSRSEKPGGPRSSPVRNRSSAVIMAVLAISTSVGLGLLLLRGKTEAPPAVASSPPRAVKPTSDEPRPIRPPEDVTIQLNSDPPRARVLVEADRSFLGLTPYVAKRARAESVLQMVVEMAGFKPRTVSAPLTADFEETVILERRSRHTVALRNPPAPTLVSPAAQPAPSTQPLRSPAQPQQTEERSRPKINEWPMQ